MVETATPIAVIGAGCRFPGGVEDLDGLWDLLAGGVDAIGDIPPDRWSVPDFADPDPATPERTEVRQGGFLRGDVTGFDAAFFGMAPREQNFKIDKTFATEIENIVKILFLFTFFCFRFHFFWKQKNKNRFSKHVFVASLQNFENENKKNRKWQRYQTGP